MYILYRCMQLWGSLNSVEPLSKSFKSFVFRTFGYRFYTIYWTPQLHTHIQQIHIHIFIFRTPIDRTPVEGALSFLLFFLKRQPKLYFRLLCIRKYNTIWINYQTRITYVIIIINIPSVFVILTIFFVTQKMSLQNFNTNYTYFQLKIITNYIDFINNLFILNNIG